MKLIAHFKAKEPIKLRLTVPFAQTAMKMRELAPLVGRHPQSARAYISYALLMLQDKAYHAYCDYNDLSWMPQLERLLDIVSTGPRMGDYDHYHMQWLQTWFEHSGARSLILNETQLEGMAYYARHTPHFRGVSIRDFIGDDSLEVIKRKAHAALASFSAAADEAERRRDAVHLAREVRLMDEANARELERQRAVKAYEELQAGAYAAVRIGDESFAVSKAVLDGTGKLQRPGTELAASPQVLQSALAGGARPAKPDTVRMVGAGGIVSEFDKLPGGFIGEVRSIKIGDGPEYVVDRPGPQRPSLYDEVMKTNMTVFKPRAVGTSFDAWRQTDKTVNFMERYGSGAATISKDLGATLRETMKVAMEKLVKQLADEYLKFSVTHLSGAATAKLDLENVPLTSGWGVPTQLKYVREDRFGVKPGQPLRTPERIAVTGRRIREVPTRYQDVQTVERSRSMRSNLPIMPPPRVWTPRPPSLPMALSLWDDELPHLMEWHDRIPGIQPDLTIWTSGPLNQHERGKFWRGKESNTLILVYYYKPTHIDGIRMEVLKYSPVRGLDAYVYAETSSYRSRRTAEQVQRMPSATPILDMARRDFNVQEVPEGFYAAMAVSVWRRNGVPFYYYQTQEANGGLQGAGGGTLEELEEGQTPFLKLLFERAI